MSHFELKNRHLKSREKWELTSLDFKKTDVFLLTKSLDRFLGTVPWTSSLEHFLKQIHGMGFFRRVLGVISDGCMVGLGNLIWTIGCEGMIKSEGAIGHLWGDQK